MTTTDREAAIARAKELAAQRRAGSASASESNQVAVPVAVPARHRQKGPSAGRILAAAGATAAGVCLIGILAAGAQRTPSTVAPSIEYRTVVVQVREGATNTNIRQAVEAASQVVTPAPAPVERAPATQTQGS